MSRAEVSLYSGGGGQQQDRRKVHSRASERQTGQIPCLSANHPAPIGKPAPQFSMETDSDRVRDADQEAEGEQQSQGIPFSRPSFPTKPLFTMLGPCT